jgi:hypothetical protein
MLVTHHSAGNNSTADGGGCCGNEDSAGANSNKDADCSIAGKEVLVPPLKQQENTKEGPSLHSIVPRKSCWCPHDTSLNHFDTAWACKWMTKTNKVKKKCTFALCNACFIVLSTMTAQEGGHYERKVNTPILTKMRWSGRCAM